MPEQVTPHSKPDGQAPSNKPASSRPVPEAAPDAGKEEARRSLVSPDMEEPAETNRPPLGN
jgi:hypothetical protein